MQRHGYIKLKVPVSEKRKGEPVRCTFGSIFSRESKYISCGFSFNTLCCTLVILEQMTLENF